jgi:hypothetical protein
MLRMRDLFFSLENRLLNIFPACHMSQVVSREFLSKKVWTFSQGIVF